MVMVLGYIGCLELVLLGCTYRDSMVRVYEVSMVSVLKC